MLSVVEAAILNKAPSACEDLLQFVLDHPELANKEKVETVVNDKWRQKALEERIDRIKKFVESL